MYVNFIRKHKFGVVALWLIVTILGGIFAPKAASLLTNEFSLPGQPAYETNSKIVSDLNNGGENAPLLISVRATNDDLRATDVQPLRSAISAALPGTRIVSYAESSSLLSNDSNTGFIIVYPPITPGGEPYTKALPILTKVVANTSLPDTALALTGKDVLTAETSGGGEANILVETIFGGVAALVILVVIFGSVAAFTPLIVAVSSILTTFLAVYGIASFFDVSAIVQFLLSLIGLGVAIDYSLLIVTRWREELSHGKANTDAVRESVRTAGRSVIFSGLTVSISLAVLIALPIPFLQSVGFTGLLIPLVSVIASLSLLPALLFTFGQKLLWPRKKIADPQSKAWTSITTVVVRHRWLAAAGSALLLLALAAPVLTLHLGEPSVTALTQNAASKTAVAGVQNLQRGGVGQGLLQPVEIVTDDATKVIDALTPIRGIRYTNPVAYDATGTTEIITAWSIADAAQGAGQAKTSEIRSIAEAAGARVGGINAQNSDYIQAVYINSLWVLGLVVVATFILLARSLRSIILPLKALALNVLSIAAAYGMTTLIWQHGVGTELLFNQAATGAVTIWVPTAVFAFLFGLSMDYEVFLLSRIREEYDKTGDTDAATIRGVSYTGRLVTSAALILFCAFISLSRVPVTEVKILATALALGILIDATIVRGILAPALVAGFGKANWWWPFNAKR